MFRFNKKKITSYAKTINFLDKHMNNKNTKVGMIITNKKIRMSVDTDYYDSYSHMSYRLTDGAIIFKNEDIIDEYNYDCIILPNNEIYINKKLISNDNKFIVRDEFNDPETYMVDKDLYYDNLIQVSKINFELI